jgi:hypothetical protein
MAANHVGALTPDNFGSFSLGAVNTLNPNNTSTITTIPTVGTSYIIRRITVNNPSGSVATANVTIVTSSDGNTSNAVTNAAVLSTLSAVNKYQDLPLATGTTTGTYSGSLYVVVNTASGNANTVDIQVYGDIVNV